MASGQIAGSSAWDMGERNEMARIIQMSCASRMSIETAMGYANNLVRAGFGKRGSADEYYNDGCPCGHNWGEHRFDVGCIAGWEYNGPDPGIATKDGCGCQLVHVEKSL